MKIWSENGQDQIFIPFSQVSALKHVRFRHVLLLSIVEKVDNFSKNKIIWNSMYTKKDLTQDKVKSARACHSQGVLTLLRVKPYQATCFT